MGETTSDGISLEEIIRVKVSPEIDFFEQMIQLIMILNSGRLIIEPNTNLSTRELQLRFDDDFTVRAVLVGIIGGIEGLSIVK